MGELMAAQAAYNMSRADCLALESAGLEEEKLYLWGLLGACNITLSEDETTWEPGGTARAFITPARIDHVSTPESASVELVAQYGNLVDLVAWHPERPECWALRTGNAEWLGACEPQMMGGVMLVKRSPLSWLKAGCVGVVALSAFWQERQRLLAMADTLIAEDFEHAQELRQLMERPSYIPNVRVV